MLRDLARCGLTGTRGRHTDLRHRVNSAAPGGSTLSAVLARLGTTDYENLSRNGDTKVPSRPVAGGICARKYDGHWALVHARGHTGDVAVLAEMIRLGGRPPPGPRTRRVDTRDLRWHVFDVIGAEGVDVAALPYVERLAFADAHVVGRSHTVLGQWSRTRSDGTGGHEWVGLRGQRVRFDAVDRVQAMSHTQCKRQAAAWARADPHGSEGAVVTYTGTGVWGARRAKYKPWYTGHMYVVDARPGYARGIDADGSPRVARSAQGRVVSPGRVAIRSQFGHSGRASSARVL